MTPTSETISSRVHAHVLIMDDDPDTREMYEALLTHLGFRVTVATSASDALVRARTLRPDVITTDQGRRGAIFDGRELTRLLKESPETDAIPVIAVTAWAGDADRIRAFLAGCDAVLTKPCSPPDLLAEILRVLVRTA